MIEPNRVFLYDEDKESLLAAQCDSIVFGGPRMGKTAMLRTIQETLNQGGYWGAGRNSLKLIKGTSNNAKDEILESLADRTTPVLIDDLDWVFDNDLEDAFRNRGSTPLDRSPVIVSSATPVQSLDRAAAASRPAADNHALRDSRGLAHFDPTWLVPWRIRGWRSRLERKLKAEPTELDDTQVAMICDVSGGHPEFVAAAFAKSVRFPRIHGDESSAVRLDLQSQDLTDYLVINLGETIDRAYKWIRQELASEAVDALLWLAEREPGYEAELPLGEELTKSGLTIWKDGLSQIPCEAIRRLLYSRSLLRRPAASSRRGSERTALRLEASSSGDEGWLRWSENGQPKELKFPPAEWEIIQQLKESKGELVTVDEIQKELGMQEETTVRSTLQRLRKNLQLVGFTDVLINVRRRGYKLSQDIV